MKNTHKNNYSGKNSKKFQKNSNSNFYTKSTNSSKNNNRFLINADKNKSVNNLNEKDRNKKEGNKFTKNEIFT